MYRIGGQCGAVVLVLTLTLVTQLYRVQRSYHSQEVSRNQHTPSRCVIKLHIFGVFSCQEVVKYIWVLWGKPRRWKFCETYINIFTRSYCQDYNFSYDRLVERYQYDVMCSRRNFFHFRILSPFYLASATSRLPFKLLTFQVHSLSQEIWFYLVFAR